MTRGKPEKRVEAAVIGIDTETFDGPPITLQFYSEHTPQINGCVFLGKRDATEVFLKQCGKLSSGDYRMYCHNLDFDAISLLWAHRDSIKDGDIELNIGRWQITGRYSKPVFIYVSDGVRRIQIVDSMLWFNESLAKAAERVCPHLPKLKRIENLGQRLFTAKDADFVAYAMRDAEIAFFAGVEIEKFHREMDIPAQISLAKMAATVFQRHYMKSVIWQPPEYKWMAGAAASYHGGLNRVVSHTPSWHQNVTSLDISSAYPYAMTTLPDFSNPNLYKSYKNKEPRKIEHVPPTGVYCVSGMAAKCDWPALFDHDFQPLQGRFIDVWMTGREINAALAADELKIFSITGYHYDDERCNYSPFAAYSKAFYKLKSDPSQPRTLQYMYKILLNALTGKFIQTSPDWSLIDNKLVKTRRAGGLYHPFIASLITGHTRASIHSYEHEYKAIHTATDGIFVPHRKETTQKKELGALISEYHGDLFLFRNKLYAFYADKKPPEGTKYMDSMQFKDNKTGTPKYLVKYAMHGFQGNIGQLEQMIAWGNRDYTVTKRLTLKTAMRGDGIPNRFIPKEMTLNVGQDVKVYKYA